MQKERENAEIIDTVVDNKELKIIKADGISQKLALAIGTQNDVEDIEKIDIDQITLEVSSPLVSSEKKINNFIDSQIARRNSEQVEELKKFNEGD